MKIFIRDRVELVNALPRRGTYEDSIVQDDLRKKLALTQTELDEVELQTNVGENGQQSMFWRKDKDVGVEIEFTKRELQYLDRCKLLPTTPEFRAEYERVVLGKKTETA
ncbi:MAG TPA: hypothetical protein VII11_00635 [Bacteroidota bacterium]